MKLAVSLLALAWGSAAVAQELTIDRGQVEACLWQSQVAGDPGECVAEAQESCLTYSAEDTPAAGTLCFTQAQDQWAAMLGASMAALKEALEPQAFAMAQINAQYDMLTGLLQCDRVEALAKVGEAGADQIGLQKARCTAMATGLGYARLVLDYPGQTK